jgi:hypothetical protein
MIRLIKHEAVPRCGSYEVRFADGRPSRFFYWDDIPGRRLNPKTLTGEQAEQWAKTFARGERDKAFVADMRAYFAAQDKTKADEIASRQIEALKPYYAGKLRLSDVKAIFLAEETGELMAYGSTFLSLDRGY